MRPSRRSAALLPRRLLILVAVAVATGSTDVGAQDPPPATEQQREDIFNKAFGKKRPERRIQLPVILDRRHLGDIQAVLSSDGARARVDAAQFAELMRDVLDPLALQRLLSKKDPAGLLGTEALAEESIRAVIDPSTVSLMLSIEPEARRLANVGLRGAPPTVGPNGLSLPASVSSYVNMRTGLDYEHRGAGGASRGRQPINASFDMGTNVLGTAFEGTFNFSEEAQRRWQRGDFRLVQDDPESAVRYIAGDLAYPVEGFQSFLPAGGFTVAKNFALQPYQVVQPAGQQQILLRSDSRVDVFVNGRRNQTLSLPAGRYNLRDFPFTQGANDAELQITDNVGRVTSVAIPFFFSSDLLAPGLSQYAYSIGARSRDDDALRRYSGGVPVFSALHNYGLTDTVTIGGNAQGTGSGQMVGGQVTTATPLGVFAVDVAGSHSPGGMDTAVRLGFNDISGLRANSTFQAVTATVTYTGREFRPLGDETGGNNVAVDISANYSRALADNLVASVGGSYLIGRDGQPDSHAESVSVRRVINRYLSTSVDFGRSTSGTGEPEYRALFRVSLITSEPNQFVEASYDVKPHAARVDWQYSPDFDIRKPAANLSVERRQDAESVTGGVRYTDYRFETSLTHDDIIPRGDLGTAPRRTTSLRLGTALAFADGHFAVARPISDSFAMVVPHPNFADKTIGVEPSEQRWRSQADFLGPAVVPNLSSYQLRSLNVVVPNLSVGFDIGQDAFQLQPTYRSGTVITVGTAATIMLDGSLQGVDGKPVELIAGVATPTGKSGGKPHQFFTNRRGRFRIDGLNPGRYDLTFPELGDGVVHVEIPESAEGIHKIGVVRLGK